MAQQHDERAVAHHLHKKFGKGNDVCLDRAYVWDKKYECDFVRVTKGLLVHEYELKRTRKDFFADFQKIGKHRKLASGRSGLATFTFVVRFGQIEVYEVPDYAGLILYLEKDNGVQFQEVRKAPVMPNRKRLSVEDFFRIAKNLSYRSYLKDKGCF
jgi:hypothetical protein